MYIGDVSFEMHKIKVGRYRLIIICIDNIYDCRLRLISVISILLYNVWISPQTTESIINQ